MAVAACEKGLIGPLGPTRTAGACGELKAALSGGTASNAGSAEAEAEAEEEV